MKFLHVDGRLTIPNTKAAKHEFNRLCLELGIRENNQHVGSGLGGNNLQLLTLMCMKNTLVARPIAIKVDDDRVAWGADWLAKTPIRDLRSSLDMVFNSIDSKYKQLPKAFINGSHIHNYWVDYPGLTNALTRKLYWCDPAMSDIEQLIVACQMCQELSSRLDKGDMSLIQTVGKSLMTFPNDIILYSIRKYVGIERLVEHNLDEDVVFAATLNKITKDVG